MRSTLFVCTVLVCFAFGHPPDIPPLASLGLTAFGLLLTIIDLAEFNSSE